ncbi:MAG TPA: efflux transporter outer membrane subunit [Ramlibacter sp.]|jgi:NodT family efflux transporter outer membrane factor (OMF) lipoprotein|nr:efflux transporter outer membrane subunit [Ramlibacter sp.]HZY20274.1 efflux transporter outer membrane subunit [Ramlibacter sp.]
MTRTWAAAAAAALLAGCSLIPAYERPAAPVPATIPYPAASEGTAAPVLEWQRFFADERLRNLIGTALVNNRDLRVAMLNVQQARAQYDIRRADRYPNLGASLSASRAPSPISGDQLTTYQVGLAVTAWELDFFGRIGSLSEAALAQFFATEEGSRAAQVTLVGSVAATWLSLVADEELLALTQQTLATREETLRLTRLRFDNGVSSELDLRLAQSLAETARAAFAQQQRQRALDLNALGLLLGEALPTSFSTGTTLATTTFADLPAGVPSEVLVQRPDVRQAEQQLIAANASIGAARAAFFPRISLTASAGRASTELSGLFDGGGKWAYTIAPSLLLPIFDAGRNRANLEAANVQREIAVAQYERAIQSAFREVSDALAGRTLLTEQLEAQARVAEAESVRVRLSQLRYDAGVASTLDLLDAQRSLFTARQSEIQTRLARLQNQVLLYRTLGGGWTRQP